MKKIKSYINYCLLVVIICMAYSCNGFDEINTNPDSATTATPGMLATGQLKEALRIGGKSDPKWYFGDMFFTKMISWHEGSEDSRRSQYNRINTTGFGVYNSLTNCLKMVELASDIDKEAYQGLALFIKVFRLYDTTISLGDIPYSDALKGEEGNIKPKYDTQKEVFVQMLDDLDASYTHFSNATRNFDGDFVYGGDPEKWKKAVSALQLRILMSLSKKEKEAGLNVKQRFAAIVSQQILFESNADNFQLVYGTLSSQQYPLYLSRFNFYSGVSVTIIDTLKKYQDNRLFFYCSPAKAQTKAGMTDDDWDAYLGVDPSRVYSEILDLYTADSISNINSRFFEIDNCQPTIQMGYAELNFVLAEACLRGWIDGDANSYYHKGIEASMNFAADYTPLAYRHNREITDDYIQSFLDKPELQLGAKESTFENDLNKVLTQKYLDLFMHNTYTCYYDFRRTGYPKLPVNPSTNMNTIPDKMPMRWRYEQREYDFNRENLEDAIQRQYNGNDDWNELMWILK